MMKFNAKIVHDWFEFNDFGSITVNCIKSTMNCLMKIKRSFCSPSTTAYVRNDSPINATQWICNAAFYFSFWNMLAPPVMMEVEMREKRRENWSCFKRNAVTRLQPIVINSISLNLRKLLDTHAQRMLTISATIFSISCIFKTTP